MPIYEYQCAACGHQLDALQKLSDPVLTTCPACKAESLHKQVSAAGFQLKGGGWYATDYKGKSSEPAKPVESKTNKNDSSSNNNSAA